MKEKKDDKYYIEKIVKDLNFIIKHTVGITKEQLKDNEILLDSMLFRLIQISENINRLSNEFKKLHTTIPWKQISGFRNRIVHDYGNVNLKVVFEVITKDVYILKEMFDKLI